MKSKIYFCCIIMFSILVMCLSCSSKYSKENHIKTFVLNDSLYVEKYKVFTGGTTTSDSYSYYMTDSVHFRKYIGTEYHSDEQIFWSTEGSNEVIFYLAFSKLEEEKIVNDTTKIGAYNIQDLVREGKFE